ncbi:hypothetical protein LZ554_004535 [Drepanopeziza brunnea f. sp. 'monogermtubi']|nr:hypothetical protein LZ554_004535 [Drepanopeziza brunnea f. sp. 'monogermtubi']
MRVWPRSKEELSAQNIREVTEAMQGGGDLRRGHNIPVREASGSYAGSSFIRAVEFSTAHPGRLIDFQPSPFLQSLPYSIALLINPWTSLFSHPEEMAFSRFAALRSSIRAARPTAARPQLFRQVVRRGYASGSHEPAQASGDALWAAAAVAVTIPSCWWILSKAPDASHGHGGHGGEHGEAHGEEHKEEAEEEAEDKAEEKSDEAEAKSDDSGKSEESDSDDDKDESNTPKTSDDEGEEKSSDDGKNTKTIVPDAKGGNKKRLESNKGIKAGETDSEDSSDKAASSKPVGDKNSQTSKQEGLTNTDTKHSTDITNDPTKSKKGEGAPETAKVKGTVDPNRPQV